MAVLTVVAVSRAGVLETLVAAAAGGDSIPNDGQTFLIAANGGASPCTLTFDITSTVDGQAVVDRTVVLAAGERRLIGPFPPSVYGVSLGVTYSSEADITLNPFRLVPALP